MSKVNVRLKLSGLNKLMRSPEVTAEVARRVKRGAAAAGDDYEGVVIPHKYTARGFVRAKEAGKRVDDGALIRALDAMR